MTNTAPLRNFSEPLHSTECSNSQPWGWGWWWRQDVSATSLWGGEFICNVACLQNTQLFLWVLLTGLLCCQCNCKKKKIAGFIYVKKCFWWRDFVLIHLFRGIGTGVNCLWCGLMTENRSLWSLKSFPSSAAPPQKGWPFLPNSPH